MRRAFLCFAMGIVVTAPVCAAEKPSLPQAKPVAHIDGLIATAAKGNIVIQANGAVTGGGWHAAKLLPVKAGPGDGHTIVLSFVAVPPLPTQAVIEGLLPITANATTRQRRGIFSVRVLSGSNEITTQILK